MDWDPRVQRQRPLCELLGLPRRGLIRTPQRVAGPIVGPRFSASDLLQSEAIGRACRFEMAPLSAFDARAWDRLYDGWELKENRDRRREQLKRSTEVERVERMFGQDTPEGRRQREQLLAAWAGRPEDRAGRTWDGWWPGAEA